MVHHHAEHIPAEGDKLDVCHYLEWELVMDRATFKEFEDMVRKDFAGIDPYLTCILPCNSLPAPLRYLPITLE